MTEKKFSFTPAQRTQLIKAALSKVEDKSAQSFLNRCEEVIITWYKYWPATKPIVSTRDIQHNLKNLADSLQSAHAAMKLLPASAKYAIASERIRDSNPSHKRIDKFIQKTEESMFNLALLARSVSANCAAVGGIKKECEAQLVTELADVYVRTFLKHPTVSPNGPFMCFVKEISNIINLPGGGEFKAGKDLISSAIKSKSALRDYYIQYPNP